MAKNVVVCCDGTGNQFDGDENSNVVKLYTCLAVDKAQRAYYHPGVGTMGDPRKTSWVGKQTSLIRGLAFGYGFRDNLADAYKFLMDHYETGDHIYLFGFSRGAYTVRALGAALYMYGLLCSGNEGHMPYMLDMLTRASKTDAKKPKKAGGRKLKGTKEAARFRETFSREVPIHFMGIWDTVSSVGWIYDPVKLLFDGQNPAIRRGRHAVSVDEKRCFFQNNLWGPPLKRDENAFLLRHYADDKDTQQDIVEAWFPGVHSDVGGSYDQTESGPAYKALEWILDEAIKDGLKVEDEKHDAVLHRNLEKYGDGPGQVPRKFPSIWEAYTRGEANDCMHKSLRRGWWLLEAFPHTYFDALGEERWNLLPVPHRREIPDKSLMHPALRKRLNFEELPKYPRYEPSNLNKDDIQDYSPAKLDLHHPEVMQKLADEGFGIYQAPPSPPSRKGPALAALALLGTAYLLLRKR